MRMKIEGVDWLFIFIGVQLFNLFLVFIMFKMGRVKYNRINVGLRQRVFGNLEFMKVCVYVEYCIEVKVKLG